MGKRKTLRQLFVPICIETLFYMLAGMADTLMLSSVSDQAVGAVGTANTYIGMFIIMFSVVSTGTMAVMTQNIGAGKPGIAYQTKQLSVILNTFLGIIISIILLFCGEFILDIVGIANSLREPALHYLQIVGGSCFLNALIPIFSGYLRAFGFMKQPLFAVVLANVINLGLNAVFLFVFDMGVIGVALATVISKIINLAIVLIASIKLVHAKEDKNRIATKEVLRKIFIIGFPSAMESAIYNFAIILVTRFLNRMDPGGLNVTARSYTVQITNFSLTIGLALSQANAIMTGWRVGAKLLAIDIILEIGRITNLVFGNALKTSGDAVFPVIIAAVFMILCAVLGTYFFGIQLNLLVAGAYIGLTLDECARAIAMFLRWQSGKWKIKSLV